MFKKESRYITRGANEKLDLRLQLVLWSLIDRLKEEGKELDYLQVFKVSKYENRIKVGHSQEIPKYKEIYIIDLDCMDINESIKIFIIDDEKYSTMMLSEEY